MPIKSQIQRIISKNEDSFRNKKIISDSKSISDYFDGDLYKAFIDCLESSDFVFTFTINTDEISLCEKSRQSLWPIT